jgi:hypothetical protein
MLMVVLTKTVLTNLQFKRPINMTHSPIRLFTLFLSLTASSAFAEPKVITTSDEFIELVTDKNLTRPFITLKVSSNGEIHGKGAFSKITGAWLWEDGYFCRSLRWGRTDLDYNCQRVISDGNQLTFTSDRGRGDSASFTLRPIKD